MYEKVLFLSWQSLLSRTLDWFCMLIDNQIWIFPIVRHTVYMYVNRQANMSIFHSETFCMHLLIFPCRLTYKINPACQVSQAGLIFYVNRQANMSRCIQSVSEWAPSYSESEIDTKKSMKQLACSFWKP